MSTDHPEIEILAAEEEAERVFGEAWSLELTTFYSQHLATDSYFAACNDRLRASNEYWIVILPFSHPPSARYILDKQRRCDNLTPPQKQLLSTTPMAIRSGTRIEDFVPWAPGGSLYRALLHFPPFGYVEPVRDTGVDPYSIPARITQWIDAERVLLDEKKYYLMPLLFGHLPLYAVLFGYNQQADASLQTFGLGGLIAAMEECQKSFAELLTLSRFSDILKRCAMKARSVHPAFRPSVLYDRAKLNPWQSWYTCVPGRRLQDVRILAARAGELETIWKEADAVDPGKVWDSIAAQFCSQGFFDAKQGIHEKWTDKHVMIREKIVPFLQSFKSHIDAQKGATLSHRVAARLVEHTISILVRAHEEGVQLIDTAYPFFDRLKCLYCRCYGDRPDAPPRLRQATLAVCIEIAMGAPVTEGPCDCGAWQMRSSAYSPRPDIAGINAWDEVWSLCKVVSLLRDVVSSVDVIGKATDGTARIQVEIQLESAWTGTGGSTDEVLSILRSHGCNIRDTSPAIPARSRLVGTFTHMDADHGVPAQALVEVTYRLQEQVQ